MKPSSENTHPESAEPKNDSGESYSPEEYKDPDLKKKTWCSYMEKGFSSSRTITGAVSGTNADDSELPDKKESEE